LPGWIVKFDLLLFDEVNDVEICERKTSTAIHPFADKCGLENSRIRRDCHSVLDKLSKFGSNFVSGVRQHSFLQAFGKSFVLLIRVSAREISRIT
jgi:hypothetical protein